MKKIPLIFLTLLVFSFKHPHYVSVTELKYNSLEKTIQGSVKLFVNDFENALKLLSKEKVDLIHVKDTSKTNKMVSKYLRDRLVISINNLPLNYRFLGFEHEQDVVWIYFEGTCGLPKKILMDNSLLYDFLKEQTNIVHVEANGKKQSSKATNPDKRIVFNL